MGRGDPIYFGGNESFNSFTMTIGQSHYGSHKQKGESPFQAGENAVCAFFPIFRPNNLLTFDTDILAALNFCYAEI
jgi:hypothetical protein